MVIWNSNTQKDFTPSSQGTWQRLLLKHKAHTPQKRKWVYIARFVFYCQATTNFVAKSMEKINPLLKDQNLETYSNKKIWSHMISEGMLWVAICVVMKKI